ncbi:Uncharacterised protein [Nocardia farcinica]|uniref:Uncharacterized protein n=1 Tax=Nocardia farcinica TaxID=37329 RepID=A0A449H7G0_NOCFR|nr:hypothetical protein [Nocardia farcinica]VFA93925.1 Uncharacterised protein [Nocardia farcinica]
MKLCKLISAGAMLLAAAGASLTTAGIALATPAASEIAGWTIGCVPIAVGTYSDGTVWGVENCGGLERRTRLDG